MSTALVVIIAYRPLLNPFERASLSQVFNMLGHHDICIVCPESINLSLYEPIYHHYKCHPCIERFNDAFFLSIKSYNRLMLSALFYERFLDYDYILIYQLDAWVFSDALEEWCAKGYDYIGAPWFADSGMILPFAGNGGFSLRKVKSFCKILNTSFTTQRKYSLFTSIIPFIFFYSCEKKTWLKREKERFFAFLKMLGCNISPKAYLGFIKYNEDVAWVQALSTLGYSVAPPEEAMYFAFERFPQKLYAMTRVLPFGAHALPRYAPDFWSEWVPMLKRPDANRVRD